MPDLLLQLVLRAIEGASGLVILLAAMHALVGCARREVSPRAVALLLIAFGAAGRVGTALSPTDVDSVLTLSLPIGVALWVLLAARAQLGLPMRRVYDWMCLGKRRGDARRRRQAVRAAAGNREGDER